MDTTSEGGVANVLQQTLLWANACQDGLLDKNCPKVPISQGRALFI